MRRTSLLVLLAGCGAFVTTFDAGLGQVSVVDAGRDASVDGGASDGGATVRDGGFCAPCVRSADCGAGSLCLGGLEPRCGKDCSSSMQCAEGASCTAIGIGKGPRVGFQCLAASTPSCGAFNRLTLDCRDTWANYGAQFFSTVCSGSCHRHDGTWATLADVRSSADVIRVSVETGSMPTDQTLSMAERLRLLTWFACGAP